MDKFLWKRRRCPAALRILFVLRMGKFVISHLRRALPCATVGGSALYKPTPRGARAHLPRFSAPHPLAFPLLLLYETFARLRLADLLRSHSSGATASSEEMAYRDRTRLPPTKTIDKSYKTQGMIEDLERRGVLGVGMARPPPEGEIEAKPQPDEVVVFRDFSIAGLRFPLDPVVVEIFKLFNVYTHQMTPASFVRLNLYMWLSKTYKLKPSATGFARLFRCHNHPKTVFVKSSEDAEATEADPPIWCVHLRIPHPTTEPGRRLP